jgi:hypothetical protein
MTKEILFTYGDIKNILAKKCRSSIKNVSTYHYLRVFIEVDGTREEIKEESFLFQVRING